MEDQVQGPKLKKREWDALGSLLLPPELGGKTRLSPKMAQRLGELGLIEAHTYVLEPGPGEPAWLRVQIKGHRLSQMGHILYCEWASQNAPDE